MAKKSKRAQQHPHPVIPQPLRGERYFLRLSKNGHGLGLWIPQAMQRAAGIRYGDILQATAVKGAITLCVVDPEREGFGGKTARALCDRSAAVLAESRRERSVQR